MKRILCLTLLLGLLPAPLWAGTATMENAVPAELKTRKERIITLEHENDKFGGDSDRHYTTGSRASYMDRNWHTPGFVDIIDRLVPTFASNDTTTIIYSVGQNIFTPEDKTIAAAQPDERPWAAFLYGSVGIATLTDNHVDEIELTMGMVGPAALGEPVQKFVHRLVDAPEPQGWDNQLKNEPGIILSVQRRWPEAWSMGMGRYALSAAPYGGLTAGNIYTYANTGLNLRFGSRSARWDDMPLRVRPAMPGTGYFDGTKDGGPDWFIFGGLDGRAVARNIFLDGNTFTDSASVDKLPFVLDANLGVSTTWGPARLSYTIVWRSKEFQGQHDPDIFGAFSVGYRF